MVPLSPKDLKIRPINQKKEKNIPTVTQKSRKYSLSEPWLLEEEEDAAFDSQPMEKEEEEDAEFGPRPRRPPGAGGGFFQPHHNPTPSTTPCTIRRRACYPTSSPLQGILGTSS